MKNDTPRMLKIWKVVTLKEIDAAAKTRTAGEPRFRLPTRNILIRELAVRPLVIQYGVHEVRLFVFIQDIAMMAL